MQPGKAGRKEMKSKAPDEEGGNEFAKVSMDPRLTPAENVFLVGRLSEMREAFVELLLSRRQKSHGRDVVAG
jgi:hypothetical protein